MECSRCNEKQDQETTEEVLVSGLAADVWVCLKCQDAEANTCERCGESAPAATLDDYLECADCQDNRNERAYEASLSDYYGGSSAQTLDEQHAAAYAVKQGLK